jgi:chromosomal replication initiator protein
VSAEPRYTQTDEGQQRDGPGTGGPGHRLAETDFATAEEFWSAVQDSIQERLGHRRYSLWFHQTELMDFTEDEVVVGVPNIIIQQYLSQRYARAVAAAIEELLGEPVAVRFDVAPRLFRQARARREQERRESEREGEHAVDFRRATRQARVPTDWGFDHLVVTRSNRLPFAAARELAGQENPRFRLLYVCGDYGLGKSALLRAIYALACSPGRGLDPVLMSAEDWCNEYYHAIQHKTTRQFRSRYRSRRMLLLDDVQFVDGKAGGQRELLHTIKHILGEGGRIALGGKPHPEQLREVDPAFRALLGRAFTAVLLPPAGDERLEIVQELAARRGLSATREVLEHVAGNCGADFGNLETAVNGLALYATVHGHSPLGLTPALEALAAMQPLSKQRVSSGQIMETVLEVFGLKAEKLTGKCRTRTVVLARQVGMYLARKLTGESLAEIGRSFGRSSHSTVKHAIEKIEKECEQDSQLAGLVQRIESNVRPD